MNFKSACPYPKNLLSVCAALAASNPLPTRLIDLNVCMLLQLPPLPAVQRDVLKLKPPLFSKQTFISPPSPQPLSLPLPPTCLLTLFRSVGEAGGRGFALITDLLYTPVNRDRDALLTPPLAHCHIPSIPALLSKPMHQGAHGLTCDWGLFLIVWQHLGECSPLTDVRTSKGRRRCSQIRRTHRAMLVMLDSEWWKEKNKERK